VPIKSYKVGAGLLRLGEAASPMEATPQVTELAVEWSEDVEDAVPTLSGEELAGEATYTATLTGTVLQDDLQASGLVRWSWANKGKVLPFEFVPNNDLDTGITGMVRVAPLNVGGAVKSRPTSDFEWACIGEPEFADALV
jgi:hypothetical protein